MSRDRRRFAIVLASILGVTPIAAAQSAFDGAYSGQRTIVADRSHRIEDRCQAGAIRFTVQNGRFPWRVPYIAEFTIPVGSDGSFGAHAASYEFSGKITGGHMTANSQTTVCSFHFEATKQ